MRRCGRLLFGLLLVCLAGTASPVAQKAESGSADDRLQRIEETLRTLSNQIADLNARLRPAQPASPIEALPALELTLSGAPRRGSLDAKIVLVEFSDFQCPFCARHAQATYGDIQRDYVNTGKIQYAFRHFPIEKIHPAARQAAEAAACASEQSKFWEFHDRLFLNQHALALANLQEHANAIHVDLAEFEACMADRRTAGRVTDDLSDARRLGLTATPAFVIGELQANGTVRVSRRIVGAQPFQIFQLALDEVLSSQR